MGTVKLQITNLVKVYNAGADGIVRAVDGISYNFPNRGLLFLVGKSGCGKTTLLNILGLLDKFTGGEYTFNGKNIRKMTTHEKDCLRSKSIGFVFQDFSVIGKYNIGRNISLAKEISAGRCTKAEVNGILEKVGLAGFYKRKSGQLSGGQLQRVAVARALIKNPDIILADEPTGSLDSSNSAMILEMLKAISLEKLVIVVTHDRKGAEKYGDTILEICDGRIVGEITPPHRQRTSAEAPNRSGVTTSSPAAAANARADTDTYPLMIAPKAKNIKRNPARMPAKTTVNLGLLNLRSMWMRTIMAVLVSVFALSFVGFSLMMSGFDANRKLTEYVKNENLPFVSVEAKTQIGSGIFGKAHNGIITNEILSKFETAIGGGYATRSAFIEPINMGYANYNDLPQNGALRTFYPAAATSMIEYDNLGDMGLTLAAGHEPENENEVLITSYHLEAYRRLGQVVGSVVPNHPGVTYLPGDTLRVVRGRSTISVLKNGILQWTDTLPESCKYMQITTSAGVSAFEIRTSENITNTAYNRAYNAPYLTFNGSTITVSGATDSWFVSTLDFTPEWAEFTVPNGNNGIMLGYSSKPNVNWYSDPNQTLRRLYTYYGNGNILYWYNNDTGDNYDNIDTFDDILLRNVGSYTIVGVVDIDLSKFADLVAMDEHDDNYKIAKNYDWVKTARDEYLNVLYSKKGAFNKYLAGENSRVQSNFITDAKWQLNIEGEERIYQTENLPNYSLQAYQHYIDSLPLHTAKHTTGINEAVISIGLLPFLVSSETMAEYEALTKAATETGLGGSFTNDDIDTAQSAQADLHEFLEENLFGRTLSVSYAKNIKDVDIPIAVSDIPLTIVALDFFEETILVFLTNDFYTDNPLPLTRTILTKTDNLGGILALGTFSVGEFNDLPVTAQFYPVVAKADEIYILDGYLSLVIMIFNVLSYVFILFAFLITMSLISNSIKARQNDIGILRSLGVSKFSVSLVFIFECLIIAIFEIILSAVSCVICYNIMRSVLQNYVGRNIADYDIISLTFGRILTLCGIATGSLAVSLALPLVKISSKQPVEIMRRSTN